MPTVTLHCQAGNHSWERPSQRGRRPLNCPAHSAQVAAVTAPVEPAADDALDQELLDLYMAETGLGEHVVAAFLRAGVEPPARDMVDRIGYTFKQRIILDAASTPLPDLGL